MLSIRSEQLNVFEKTIQEDFEDEMVEYLGGFAASHCHVIGEQGVRNVIHLGTMMAERYGLTYKNSVKFYLELMFVFGSYFDSDSQYPWAGEILNDTGTPDQMERADKLYVEVSKYLNKVAGPLSINTIDALRALKQRTLQKIQCDNNNFEKYTLENLRQIFPQKYYYVGETALVKLISEATQLADHYEIKSMRGKTLFVALMFAAGHGFYNDPLLPWVARTLCDPLITEPEKRVKRLERKAIVYLNSILEHMKEE